MQSTLISSWTFKVSFGAPPSGGSADLLCLWGLPMGERGVHRFYSRCVPVPQLEMHAVDRYLLVAKAVGAVESGAPEFRFRIPQTDYEEVDRLLSRSGVKPGTSWVAMNVSARWPTKRWPAASFAEVADRLQQEGCGAVVMISGPDERADVAAVSGMMKTPAIDLAGATTVGLLPALLSRASLLIANDCRSDACGGGGWYTGGGPVRADECSADRSLWGGP